MAILVICKLIHVLLVPVESNQLIITLLKKLIIHKRVRWTRVLEHIHARLPIGRDFVLMNVAVGEKKKQEGTYLY